MSSRTEPAFIIVTLASPKYLIASVARLQSAFSEDLLICPWDSLDTFASLYTFKGKGVLPTTLFNTPEKESKIELI